VLAYFRLSSQTKLQELFLLSFPTLSLFYASVVF
jgi:hypothetical protein